jgi:hypothetical protein
MKDFNWKWKWALALLSFALIMVISWEIMLPKALEAFLYHSGLEVENLYRENEYWVIDNPRFRKDKQNQFFDFKAPSASLKYGFNLWKGEINLYLTLNKPEFKIRQPDPEFILRFDELKNITGSFWTLNKQMAIHKGKLVLDEHEYDIEGELKLGASCEANLQIDFDALQKKNHLSLHAVHDLSSVWQVDFQCKDIDCFHLHHAASYLFPELQNFKIYQGILNGTGGLILGQERRPIVYAEANLVKFDFEHIPSDLKASLQEVRFHLQKDSGSSGSIIFCGDESLTYAPLHSQTGEIRNLLGGIYVDDQAQAKIVLNGIYDNFGQIHHLAIEGEASLPSQTAAALHLNWKLENNQHQSSGFLKAKELAGKMFEMKLDFQQMRFQDGAALQAWLHCIFPSLGEMRLQEGTLDMSACAYFKQKRLEKVLLDNINISQMKAEYSPFRATIALENVSGHGTLDFAADLFEDETSFQLNVTDGQLYSWDRDLGKIENIHAHVNMHKGVFVNSYAEGRHGGVQGHLDVDTQDGQAIQLNLQGDLYTVFQHIPDEKYRKRFSRLFDRHQWTVKADLKHSDRREEVIGLAKIIDPDGLEKSVTFGFEFSPHESLIQNYPQIQAMMPAWGIPLFNSEMPEEGYQLNKGWFQASEFPLDKYVAPLLMDGKWMQLTGEGDFSGTFDQRFLAISYGGRQVHLENPGFVIEAAEIHQSPHTYGKTPVHYFDFVKGTQIGLLPLSNATYFEKNSGLLFTDVNVDVIFDGQNIHMPSMEAFSQGIYMAGSLELDLKDPHEGYYDVDMHLQTLHGKVSQVQSFFSHFQKALFFLKIPLEGDVSMHQDAGHMHFAFSPQTYTFQMKLKGSLADGVIAPNDSQVALHELSLTFDYDHQANVLDFSDIQGTLLVGEPSRVEEYTVVGERIRFSDYANNRSSFDLWVGDKKRDMIRVTGETFPSLEDPACVQFVLDRNLSHFGNVHPNLFHLVLKDWCEIQEFQWMADFKLSTLFQDLQRFSRTGFLFLSRHALKQLNDIKRADGNFKMAIEYDGKRSQLDYHLTGEDIAIDSHTFHTVQLEGKKRDNTWTIDQLVLDNISFAADVLRKPGSWYINFLGARLGDSILMGLQGEYFEDSRVVEGKVNLLEIDFAALNEWPKMQEVLKDYPLKGHLRASGPFQYELSEHGQLGKLEMSFQASLKGLQFKNLIFDDMQNLSLHYESEKGLTISKIQTALKSENTAKKAILSLEKFAYDQNQEVFSLENLAFAIPFSHLSPLIEQLSLCFPHTFSPAAANILLKAKQAGDLEGSVNFDYASPHYGIKLSFKDGDYQFLNKNYKLSHFSLEYDPCEVKVTAQCQGEAFPFWVQSKSSSVHLDQGEVTISEEPPEQTIENPLVLTWQNDQHEGFLLQQARGVLHGMDFALERVQAKRTLSPSQFLQGVIKFNAKDAVALISKELSENFAIWQIGAGYCLKGEWELRPSLQNDEPLKTYFTGHLEGQNFEFMGYRLAHLEAAMQSSPEEICLKNVHAEDPCGHLKIPEVLLSSHQDSWKMQMAKAEALEFKPNLLQSINSSELNSYKTLEVRELSLSNFQGILGETPTFAGKGFLHFVNPPKKNTLHPLFAIPGEILTHLGLDLAVLNPVIGTIFYELKEGKIYITKLKDTYSQGKLSKFYLPSDSPASYLDFDGNLHVQIKMKQYNIFFKLAELFTVTVQGTLDKPSYSLQKQK